jgi:hypothetical protein
MMSQPKHKKALLQGVHPRLLLLLHCLLNKFAEDVPFDLIIESDLALRRRLKALQLKEK